ncbi:MAG: formimidoylglutamate deiminase [Gemmatimonadetes bacterium]|nr:MAG: formimidoylglutamate deiminase [Gemmatimonadota bacterium]
MPSFLAPQCLLPDGWADDVVLDIDAAGWIEGVRPLEDPSEPLERLHGPVVPGLIDLHSHAFQRAMAGLAERGSPAGDHFWTWRDAMYRFALALEPEDLVDVARQLYVELLRGGYTCVVEFHYLHNAPDGRPYDALETMSMAVVEASLGAGIGLTHLPTLYRTADFGGAPPLPEQRRFVLEVEALLALRERLEARLADDPDRRTGLALHSLRAVPPGALERTVAAVHRASPDAPVHIHVAEQTAEVDACLAWSRRRPVAWLLDHAPVDARWCLVHATHMSADETAALAATGAVAGLCPTTEANLGDGFFPLRPFLDAGGRFGVGSDANVCVDATEELRLLELGQRLLHRERNVTTRGEARSTGRALLEGALAGGAQAARLAAGSIEAGRRADLVVLDRDHPGLVTRSGDALLDAWIFGPARGAVRDVMVGGRWVVREGRHAGEVHARERYRAALERIAERCG